MRNVYKVAVLELTPSAQVFKTAKGYLVEFNGEVTPVYKAEWRAWRDAFQVLELREQSELSKEVR